MSGYIKFYKDIAYIKVDIDNLPENYEEVADYAINNFLTPEYANAIKWKYGICGEARKTYKEAGAAAGISMHQARGRWEKAIRLLRRVEPYKYFKKFFTEE